MEKIKLTVPDIGEEVEFFVLEQTRVNGVNYLLVTENDDEEESDAYILKDMSKDEDVEAIYEFVEDDVTLEAVSKVFAELLDDVDFE